MDAPRPAQAAMPAHAAAVIAADSALLSATLSSPPSLRSPGLSGAVAARDLATTTREGDNGARFNARPNAADHLPLQTGRLRGRHHHGQQGDPPRPDAELRRRSGRG